MQFFQVLPKEKQNLKSVSKRYVLQQSPGLQTFIKNRLQHGCLLPVNIPKVLETTFLEQFRWLFFNYVLVSKRILKKGS